ncbi:hypothetical protein BUALT_Bualt12G0062500 [Buddleja alternifolia]|uniref:Protein FAR1-RELATED SEQUENCE n=1 Tax=Buddleja alternifolia TaxID=168488 RepID=A0AAV6WVC3_9LAMI|nr:hypothetical protein BUALT_Bualt12G0062500 [Buddleja alternifolia]
MMKVDGLHTTSQADDIGSSVQVDEDDLIPNILWVNALEMVDYTRFDFITTLHSESLNGVLKRYVSYKHNLLQIFHHIDRLIDDRLYEELKTNLRTCWTTLVASFPVEILKHATSVYTHEVFELLQDELQKTYDAKIQLFMRVERFLSFGKHRQHTVMDDLSQEKVL